MARMIPSAGPSDCSDASLEKDIYWSLERLPEDYTVIHSLRLLNVVDGERVEQREADFIIFHRKLGILCIEAKAGHVRCERGEWLYESGDKMKHRGPYNQADTIKWKLLQRFDDLGLRHLRDRCKLTHGVWFPSLTAGELGFVDFIPEASREITLSKSDLNAPEERIRHIMGMYAWGYETDLSEEEAETVLHRVLLPEFDICPTNAVDYDYNDFVFARLLDSQKRVLDFLQEQRTAVINGAAGTGKTLVAVERAKRAARHGRVLFLCYNAMLKESIALRCADTPGIDVYTIAGYACKVCNTREADYRALVARLPKRPEEFEYDHIVIDEGQDFGLEGIDGSKLLEKLREIIEGQSGKTMYLFYDKRQFVQGSRMPGFIADADCKLTLYANCRNTRSIAKTSLNALEKEAAARVSLLTEPGAPPMLLVSPDFSEQEAYVDGQIRELIGKSLGDIVVLTCKTLEGSALRSVFTETADGAVWKETSVPVHTCRRFKGLEADAVILIDVDATIWEKPRVDYDPEPGTVFYTAASRAKQELRIVCNMDKQGCERALELMGVNTTRRPEKKLANVLGANLVR